MMSENEIQKKIAEVNAIYKALDQIDLERLSPIAIANLDARPNMTPDEQMGLAKIKQLAQSHEGYSALYAMKTGTARYGLDADGDLRVLTPSDRGYDNVKDYRTPIEALHFQPGIESTTESRYPTRTGYGRVAGSIVAPRSQHSVFGGDPILGQQKSVAAKAGDVAQDVVNFAGKYAGPALATALSTNPIAAGGRTAASFLLPTVNAVADVTRGEQNYADRPAQLALSTGAGVAGSMIGNRVFNSQMHQLTRNELGTLLAHKLNYESAEALEKAEPGFIKMVEDGLKSGSMSLVSKRDWVNKPIADFDKRTGVQGKGVTIKPLEPVLDPVTGNPITRTKDLKINDDVLHDWMARNGIPLSGPGSLSDPERTGLRKWLERAWGDEWSDAGRLFFPQNAQTRGTATIGNLNVPNNVASKTLPGSTLTGVIVTQPDTHNKLTKEDLVKRLGIYDKFELGTTGGENYWTSQFLRDRSSMDDPALQKQWEEAKRQSKAREGYQFQTNPSNASPRLGMEHQGAPVVSNRNSAIVSPTEYRQLPKHRKLKAVGRVATPLGFVGTSELLGQFVLPTKDK